MSIRKFVVSKDDSIYEAWPDVIQTDSGKLLCVFSECEQHANRDNARLVICESSDRGRTWSDKKALTEKGTAEDFFNCARISKLNDGTLAIICDRVQGSPKNRKEQIVKQYIWYSTDEGATWSEPQILPFHGIVPDKLRQLKNGRLIVAAHFQNFETDKLEEYLWYSDDNGKSWSDRIILASDSRYNLCEAAIIECENNTLVAFLRENSLEGYDMMKAISYDNGETWQGVYRTPIVSGHRATVGFLNDGKVLMTYRFIPSNALSNQNMFASLLNEEELTETVRNKQRIRIFPIDYDRNPYPDTGYTGWTQFPDGEIYVVNYIKDDSDKAYIRGYSFHPEDILLPQENSTSIGEYRETI